MKRSVQLWLHHLTTSAVILSFSFMAVWVLMIILLGYAKSFWDIYMSSEAGTIFLEVGDNLIINGYSIVLSFPVTRLAFDASLSSFISCSAIGILGQLFMVRRYFFDAQNIVVFCIWTMGCSLLAAILLRYEYGMNIQYAYFVCLVPCFLFIDLSFKLAFVLLPEINVMSAVKKARKLHGGRKLRSRLRS